MNSKVLLFYFALIISFSATAQLSDLHYLPPLKQGRNNQGIREQAIYLSTPETTAFTVEVYRGTNTTPIWTYSISNTAPAVIDATAGLTNGDNNITLVNNNNTGVVLNNSGLRFVSPSGNEFYVNYRGRSSSQAASLTTKGREALGTDFRWGGIPNLGAHNTKSNTLGIMATEDNTTVTLSGYDPNCTFRIGNNADAITANTYTFTLDANESFVFENYVGTRNIAAHIDGWIGATITSDKDIAISNGSINFGRQAGAGNRDAGIDQPVPVNNLGKDYVFVRGNGNTNGSTEFPLIIATADNTNIEIGGTVVATIDDGEYYQVPSTYFSGTGAGANMYIYTTKDTYAYQCLAGSTNVYTQGTNFIAPVNCLLPDVMDNIPNIRDVAGGTVTGGVTIIAAVNTPDANVRVFENGVEVTKPASNTVVGTSDWKTFYIPDLDGDISVQSTGPMAVGFVGFNGAQGIAGYFSGFDTVPEVVLGIVSGAVGDCFSDANIFVATENFDAYQWFYEGELIPGATAIDHSDTRAGEYFVRGTKGPCTYDSDPLTILHCDADVAITKTVADSEITEGDTTTFTIRAENNSFEDITNLQITDNIPAGLTLVSAFTNTGTWNGTVWDIGTLEPDTPVFLELEVRGDEIDIEPLLNITNTVTNTQDQTDSNLSEDILSASVIVHNDFDNDGVRDITDLDDDNDGIYDTDECSQLFCFESILNESFEEPVLTSNYQILDESAVPGWLTTATDSRIELWRSGFLGVDSFDGNQHAELNANRFGALYQNLCLTPGTVMNWSLRHRARGNGIDEMQLRIGADLASATVQQTMATDNTAWVLYSGTYTVPAGQNNTVFIFEAISTASGSISVGNFIDDININIAVPATCVDSDNDGYPDNIDLDSDNNGCTDADEWYKDNNADADDGGEYGSGTPVVDPTDGTVIAASYIEVLAPEIILENTSETTGGVDINGQNISLGDTFDYVLRFQNTGNDNATNYSIRNVLPNNVTLNSIDYSGVIGITDSYDVSNNTITFQIPDNLLEVGDPEYTIRIEVTVSGNCSDFIDACSGTLENLAYSTFQGVTNTSTFSDEPGSTSLPVCNPTPQVATNSLLNDLLNCNVARTVQLCGDNVILSAGAGFSSYVWAIDSNGNGQIDASETPINDGDPDGDPSTILVTNIGDYIVEKSGATGCADLVELITVERFGSTQTNPVISYFNQVNSDANPNNNITGEVVVCSIDGSELPQIFLCGDSDEATLQLGITDATSIEWELLDETSCTDSGDECANTNNTCTWNNISSGTNYTVTDAGKYRVVINYLNGCFSRFYFNVFENTLDFTVPTPSDIVCGTPGNIRIAGVGSSFGYQLVDVTTNSVVVPFSANNGANFDITTSGTYRVQITALDTNGDPIVGACIFETNDIGILERDYQVDITTVPADCSGFGEITIQALNVFPDYNYQLYLDDGTTLVAENVAETDNSHTFTSVLPGDYVVVTSTTDGCTDSQNITVNEIPDLDLSASITENITCNAGLITLSPSGGEPDPDYRMAIWSINGVDQYTSTTDALTSATFQTTNDFLFLNSADAGDYEFIVFDSNDCHAISNQVTLVDIGPVVIDTVSTSHTPIICAGDSSSTLTIVATGGTAPYEYSLDGTNFQTTNIFPNLSGGEYTITVRDSSGSLVSRCIASESYTINEPFRLNASATLLEDIACDPTGTLVSILNTTGGQLPYEFSFDGGANFVTNNERSLAAGNYQLVVRDALGCTLDLDLTVPSPIADPTLTTAVDYNCIGEGAITVNTSNATDFNYTYSLDGGTTTQTTNVFNNITDGSYTVTVGYASALTPNQSTIYFEDFGAGSDIKSEEAGSLYCFEPQDGTTESCNKGPVGVFVSEEYTVTNAITNTNTFLRSPQDHTGLTNGRFFAIDISGFSTSGVPQPNNILWARTDLEVLPNQDINLDFWAYNLLMNTQTDPSYVNPEILIEILDNTGTIIHTEVVAEIPKNTNDNDWHSRGITFNPLANTEIDIVFRTNRNDELGNDLVLDDISVSQLPEVCERTQDLSVLVEAGRAFEATLLNEIDPSCNGANDGAIRFQVTNFDAATGFEYSIDGGTTWITETTSPFTTPTSHGLTDGNYTIEVRKANENTCVVNFTATLTEPSLLVPTASITTDLSCTNGATITANATGGTPNYEYQLEDTAGAIIGTFDFANNGTNNVFANLTDGSYIVRVRDDNGCIQTSSQVDVNPTNPVTFNITETLCYSGANTATIQVDVTNGNGGYQFRIDGGPWIIPSPTNATTHTFTGLASGSYNIEVRDQLGCPSTANTQTVVIDPQLTIAANAPIISICDADGLTDITITANGGDTNYTYAVVNTGTTPIATDFATTNPAIGFGPGTYDVFVRDNNGTTGDFCEAMTTITITQDAPFAFTPTPTDVTCNAGNDGAINITAVSGGQAPYRYSIDGGTTYVTTASFVNLTAGSYDVRIRDNNNCQATIQTVNINQPNVLTAEATQTQAYTCLQLGQITVGSVTATAGGSGDYQYNINGGPWTASTTGGFTFTDLDDGTYTINVRDANATSCFITLPDVIINPLPTPPTVDYTVDYNCDGTGNVTITPFNASYTYILDGNSQTGATGNVFNNIAVGTFTLRVTYSPDCHVDTNVIIDTGNAFEASVTAFSNLNCNADASGSITIDADNFGAGGFEYSLNGAAFVGPFTTEQTINSLNAQAHSIEVRDVNNPTGCTVTLNQTLTEPLALTANASITSDLTCSNGGATITATATDGTPNYEYQLEITDDADEAAPYTNIVSVVTAYQSSPVFNNLPASNTGESYVIRVRDNNGCEDVIDASIVVDTPETIVFDLTPTACYTGASNGTIVVNVTDGNGGYQFRIGGGPWITPSPVTATTHTFTGLTSGSYDIEVRDQLGCPPAANTQTIVIADQLIVDVDVTDLSACSDGLITVNATGGNGTLEYAIVPANTTPATFTATNTLTVTAAMATSNPAGYDVYVQDNGGGTPICTFIEEDIIFTPVAALAVSGVATDPECFNGLGEIDITVTGGTGPYTYTLVDLSPADGIDYGRNNSNISATTLTYSGIGVGDYQITIDDSFGCSVTSTTVTINNAIEITADIIPILPVNCSSTIESDFGFEFINVITPTGISAVQYSNDGGATWQSSTELRGSVSNPTFSGTEVFPSIRVEVSTGVYCQRDFDRYIIPFPLDDLDITLSAIIVGCNDLRVTVEGSQGDSTSGYDYTYTDDPANFNTFITDPNVWVENIPLGTSHTFQNINPSTPQYPEVPLLVPGRTYVFYVRDGAGCIRQSNVNVNDIPGIGLPIEFSTDITPTCAGATTGEITFTITPDTAYPNMHWEIYELGNSTAIETSGGNVTFNTTITTSIPLGEGEYYIEVTQVAADNVTQTCAGASENVYVPELAPLSATATATRDISCNLPGLITISGITGGGGAPYTYDVSGPAGFTALTGTTDNPVEIPVNSPAGSYTVTLYDQYSCPLTLSSVTLGLTPNPTLSVSQDNCAAPITVTAVGSSAAGNFRYAMVTNGSAAPTTFEDNAGVFTNVTPGAYDVYVMDGNGCSAVETNFIVNPVLSASSSLTKTLDCTGATSDAIINIEILDGSGNYEYTITNTVGATQVTTPTAVPSTNFDYQTGIAGDYTITIYDTSTPSSTACNREFVVNVPDRLDPVIVIDTFANVTCNAADDGSISVSANPDNGIGPYTFEIISGPGSTATFPIAATSNTNTTAVFDNLEGSLTGITYTIQITAANGCTQTTTQTITQPDVITIPPAAVTVVDFACTTANNMNNASISIDDTAITGGNGNYVTYEFIELDDPNTVAVEASNIVQTGSNTSYIETDTAGGAYTINVYDQNACVGSINATILPFDELLPATITVDNSITCNLGEDITINAFGTITDSSTPAGLANYEFRQLPAGTFAAANTFTNLTVGTHDFEVRNVNTNCIVTVQHQVLEPNNVEVTATTTDVVCAGDDGTVSFTINDPINTYTGGFTWQIYDSNGTVATGDDTIIVAATGTSANVGPTTPFAIGAGEYRVEITQDSNPDCTTSELFTIAGPNGAITATPVVTPISCNPGNDGVIEITNTQGGWGDYLYYVSTTAIPDEFDSSHYSSNASYNNLAPGTYFIWIIDQGGCPTQLTSEVLANPTPIVADLRTNIANCTDFAGEIEVVGIPATNPVTGGQGSNYTYQLILNGANFGTPQTNEVFSNLGPGSYTVQITDQLGCTLLVGPQVLTEVIAPTATIVKAIDCNGPGEITITQTGGTGTFNYEVRYPGTLATDPADDTNTTGIFTGLALVGDYVFTVTDTASNCSSTVTQRLEDSIIPDINIDTFANVTCNATDDGSINVSANPDNGIGPYTFEIISGPGSTATFPIAATSNTNATAVFDNLEGSLTGITYTIQITAANGCTQTTTQTITQPDVITIPATAVSVVEFACTTGSNTNDNASITVSGVFGGSGTFDRYRFFRTDDPATVAVEPDVELQNNANNSYIETDFNGGYYGIEIFDSNGCSEVTNARILPFDEIQSAVVNIDDPISCISTGEDISIDVTSSITNFGANPSNYEFRLLPSTTYQPSNVFLDLSSGTTHTFGIRNIATGCEILIDHTVADPNTFDINVNQITEVICSGDDGSIQITITDPTYTGVYNWEVLNSDGSVTVRTDDAGTFTGNGTTADIPVAAGEYMVRVVQATAPNCPQERVFTINGPSAPLSVVANVTAEVGCTNDEGAILVTPSGGMAPYNITINNGSGAIASPNGVNSHLFQGLAAGTYTIAITDALGCSVPTTPFPNVTLITPDPIAGTLDIVGLDCPDDTNGSVTFVLQTAPARNVTPNYSYVLNTYDDLAGTTLLRTSTSQTSPIFNNLGAGFYSITVTDDIASCPLTVTPIEQIIEPSEAQALLVINSPVDCAGTADLLLQVSGGTAPYEWSEDGVNFFAMNNSGGTDTHLFSGLAASSYNYYIRETSNPTCVPIVSNTVTTTVPDALVLDINDSSVTNVSCNGESTGLIIAEADGGFGDYQYEISTNNAFTTIDQVNSNGLFTDLSVGTYYLRVVSRDCISTVEEITITEPTPLVINQVISEISCHDSDDGAITLNVTGGSGDYIYAISPDLARFDDDNVFDDLAPGDYTVIVQDSNNCMELIEFSLVAPEELVVTATPTDEICFESADGTVTLEIEGGTAPYFTALNSNDAADLTQDILQYTDLPSGTHVVFVRDANGCETNVVFEVNSGINLAGEVLVEYSCATTITSNTIGLSFEDQTVVNDLLFGLDTTDPNQMGLDSTFNDLSGGDHYIAVLHSNGCLRTFDFTVDVFEPLTIQLSESDINTITATATGGSEEYTFTINGEEATTDNEFYITATDTYTITVTDENGCGVTDNIFIEFIDIEIPTFFTPDGDGTNDFWLPRNIEHFPNIFIKVYDRYGRQVYELPDNEEGWNGLYRDYDLPTGDYWYLIKLHGENDQREFVGHFTLYR